ncbi:hypothetical protein [Citrobacter amalonaticus]
MNQLVCLDDWLTGFKRLCTTILVTARLLI